MADESDYLTTYNEFWAPILDTPGVNREDQIRRELHDYKFLMGEVPKVYCHVTNDRVSKPNTMASAVIGEHGDLYADKAGVADDLRDLLKEASTLDGLRKLVTDYAHGLDPDGEAA